MEEKFKLNKNKLNQLVAQYQSKLNSIPAKSKEHRQEIKKYYSNLILSTLGNVNLKRAISVDVLQDIAEQILDGNLIHQSYSNEETLQMLEGLSNFEIIGDWQHFYTVESQYLFGLPRDMQEKFAENFSIGNPDAKELLLYLWENHIETTGIDVIRTSSSGSTNNISIQCYAPDMRFMAETLR